MKIEKINDNKIKITLSARDLEERNLDFQALRYNSPEAQNLFWDMIKRAETEYGFRAANCQLFIEAASIMDGNFIVTITRMTEPKALPNIPFTKPKAVSSSLKVRKKQMENSAGAIISFVNIDDLYDAILSNTIPFRVNSKLFEYNNMYYLLIKPNLTQMQDCKRLISILSEFGKFERDFDYMESKKLTKRKKQGDKP
jgi:adapter protein MecA 1/2